VHAAQMRQRVVPVLLREVRMPHAASNYSCFWTMVTDASRCLKDACLEAGRPAVGLGSAGCGCCQCHVIPLGLVEGRDFCLARVCSKVSAKNSAATSAV
jgi:hypothetical protein